LHYLSAFISVCLRNLALVSKVRGILNIDIRKWRPLHPVDIPLLDAIVSCGCFESVATDVESFGDCIRNITPLLKHGGKLILLGALYQTKYMLGSHAFKTAYLTRENLMSILSKCGYKIIHIECAPRISEIAGGKEYFSLIATKEIK